MPQETICLTRDIGAEPDNRHTPHYKCPVCNAELDGGDTVSEDIDGNTVGCVYCISHHEVWEKDIYDDIIKGN